MACWFITIDSAIRVGKIVVLLYYLVHTDIAV